MEHCAPVPLGYDAEYIIHIPFPVFDWYGELRAQCKVFKILHVHVSNCWRAGGTHGGTMKLFKELVLEGKDIVLQD